MPIVKITLDEFKNICGKYYDTFLTLLTQGSVKDRKVVGINRVESNKWKNLMPKLKELNKAGWYFVYRYVKNGVIYGVYKKVYQGEKFMYRVIIQDYIDEIDTRPFKVRVKDGYIYIYIYIYITYNGNFSFSSDFGRSKSIKFLYVLEHIFNNNITVKVKNERNGFIYRPCKHIVSIKTPLL
jgi:hypothetical protein